MNTLLLKAAPKAYEASEKNAHYTPEKVVELTATLEGRAQLKKDGVNPSATLARAKERNPHLFGGSSPTLPHKGHDVSGEARVPKGQHGGGEWARTGQSGETAGKPAKPAAKKAAKRPAKPVMGKVKGTIVRLPGGGFGIRGANGRLMSARGGWCKNTVEALGFRTVAAAKAKGGVLPEGRMEGSAPVKKIDGEGTIVEVLGSMKVNGKTQAYFYAIKNAEGKFWTQDGKWSNNGMTRARYATVADAEEAGGTKPEGLKKSHIKAHTSHTKTGVPYQVAEHDDRRTKKAEPPQPAQWEDSPSGVYALRGGGYVCIGCAHNMKQRRGEHLVTAENVPKPVAERSIPKDALCEKCGLVLGDDDGPLAKSHIKAHTSHTKTGVPYPVKAHDDKRTKKAAAPKSDDRPSPGGFDHLPTGKWVEWVKINGVKGQKTPDPAHFKAVRQALWNAGIPSRIKSWSNYNGYAGSYLEVPADQSYEARDYLPDDWKNAEEQGTVPNEWKKWMGKNMSKNDMAKSLAESLMKFNDEARDILINTIVDEDERELVKSHVKAHTRVVGGKQVQVKDYDDKRTKKDGPPPGGAGAPAAPGTPPGAPPAKAEADPKAVNEAMKDEGVKPKRKNAYAVHYQGGGVTNIYASSDKAAIRQGRAYAKEDGATLSHISRTERVGHAPTLIHDARASRKPPTEADFKSDEQKQAFREGNERVAARKAKVAAQEAEIKAKYAKEHEANSSPVGGAKGGDGAWAKWQSANAKGVLSQLNYKQIQALRTTWETAGADAAIKKASAVAKRNSARHERKWASRADR